MIVGHSILDNGIVPNTARVKKIQLSVGSILDFRFWILEKSVNYVNRSLDKGFTEILPQPDKPP
jgi:hypothetical protein